MYINLTLLRILDLVKNINSKLKKQFEISDKNSLIFVNNSIMSYNFSDYSLTLKIIINFLDLSIVLKIVDTSKSLDKSIIIYNYNYNSVEEHLSKNLKFDLEKLEKTKFIDLKELEKMLEHIVLDINLGD